MPTGSAHVGVGRATHRLHCKRGAWRVAGAITGGGDRGRRGSSNGRGYPPSGRYCCSVIEGGFSWERRPVSPSSCSACAGISSWIELRSKSRGTSSRIAAPSIIRLRPQAVVRFISLPFTAVIIILRHFDLVDSAAAQSDSCVASLSLSLSPQLSCRVDYYAWLVATMVRSQQVNINTRYQPSQSRIDQNA